MELGISLQVKDGIATVWPLGRGGLTKVPNSKLDQRPGVQRVDNEHATLFKFTDAACLTTWIQAALMCVEQQHEVFAAKREARAARMQAFTWRGVLQPLATDIKIKGVSFFARPGARVLKLYLGYVEVELMRHVAAVVDDLLTLAGVGPVNLRGVQVVFLPYSLEANKTLPTKFQQAIDHLGEQLKYCNGCPWKAFSSDLKDEAEEYAAQPALKLDVVLQRAALLVCDGEDMLQQGSEEQEEEEEALESEYQLEDMQVEQGDPMAFEQQGAAGLHRAHNTTLMDMLAAVCAHLHPQQIAGFMPVGQQQQQQQQQYAAVVPLGQQQQGNAAVHMGLQMDLTGLKLLADVSVNETGEALPVPRQGANMGEGLGMIAEAAAGGEFGAAIPVAPHHLPVGAGMGAGVDVMAGVPHHLVGAAFLGACHHLPVGPGLGAGLGMMAEAALGGQLGPAFPAAPHQLPLGAGIGANMGAGFGLMAGAAAVGEFEAAMPVAPHHLVAAAFPAAPHDLGAGEGAWVGWMGGAPHDLVGAACPAAPQHPGAGKEAGMDQVAGVPHDFLGAAFPAAPQQLPVGAGMGAGFSVMAAGIDIGAAMQVAPHHLGAFVGLGMHVMPGALAGHEFGPAVQVAPHNMGAGMAAGMDWMAGAAAIGLFEAAAPHHLGAAVGVGMQEMPGAAVPAAAQPGLVQELI